MTKKEIAARRERIATAAMQAIIRKSPHSTGHDRGAPVYTSRAKGAVGYADALIRVLDGGAE